MTTDVLELVPQRGVGTVRLGMTRDEVREALAALDPTPLLPSSNTDTIDRYCEDAIQVELDGDGRVQFIGTSPHPLILLRFQGIDLFDTAARKVFDLLAEADRSGEHTFSKAEYLFPNQIVALREADRKHDPRGRRRDVWGVIGVGNRAYYEVVTGKAHTAVRAEVGKGKSRSERFAHPTFGAATLVGRTGSGEGETLELQFDDGVVRKIRKKFVTPLS
jgi:hypothetical protein